MKTPTPTRDARIGRVLRLKQARGIVTQSTRPPTNGQRLAAYYQRRELARELRY